MADDSRQAGAFDESDLITLTPSMLRAGVEEARAHRIGGSLERLVLEVYLACEIERREAALASDGDELGSG